MAGSSRSSRKKRCTGRSRSQKLRGSEAFVCRVKAYRLRHIKQAPHSVRCQSKTTTTSCIDLASALAHMSVCIYSLKFLTSAPRHAWFVRKLPLRSKQDAIQGVSLHGRAQRADAVRSQGRMLDVPQQIRRREAEPQTRKHRPPPDGPQPLTHPVMMKAEQDSLCHLCMVLCTTVCMPAGVSCVYSRAVQATSASRSCCNGRARTSSVTSSRSAQCCKDELLSVDPLTCEDDFHVQRRLYS